MSMKHAPVCFRHIKSCAIPRELHSPHANPRASQRCSVPMFLLLPNINPDESPEVALFPTARVWRVWRIWRVWRQLDWVLYSEIWTRLGLSTAASHSVPMVVGLSSSFWFGSLIHPLSTSWGSESWLWRDTVQYQAPGKT